MKDVEISTKAVLLGFLADVGSTLVLGTLTSIVGVVEAIRSGVSLKELGTRLPEIMTGPGWLAVSGLTGLACTVFGGYMAGRIAGRDHLLHGAVMGSLSVVLGLSCTLYTPTPGVPQWFLIVGILITIPAGMAGGILAGKQGKPGQ